MELLLTLYAIAIYANAAITIHAIAFHIDATFLFFAAAADRLYLIRNVQIESPSPNVNYYILNRRKVLP
jgi:hypothetical protein